MKCMGIFFLILILVQICFTTKQNQAEEITKDKAIEIMKDIFIPQGHELDCYKRCKICINVNSFINALKKYFNLFKTLANIDLAKLMELIMKEAIDLKVAHREIAKSNELIDEEMKKKEVELNGEIDQAVKTIVETEGIKDQNEVKKTAMRIRNRMLEKYRKEAESKIIKANPVTTTTITSSVTSTTTQVKSVPVVEPKDSIIKLTPSQAFETVITELYRIYFSICIVDDNKVFYSTPESDVK